MRVFKKRDKWWIDFRDPQGVRRRKPIGKSKREAQDVLETVKTSLLAGTYYNDQGTLESLPDSQLTLEQLWKEFKAGRTGVSPSTAETDRMRVERIILPFFGRKTQVSAIRACDIAKFVRWREDRGLKKESGVTKSTIARDIMTFRSMWKWGSEFLPGGLPPSPIPTSKRLNLPYQAPSRIDFFSREELDSVLSEAKASSPARLYPGVAIGAFAGLRRSEICNLRWQDIDLDTGHLKVRNYKSGARTKNEEDRIVPIRAALAEILREVQDLQLEEGGLPELIMPANRAGQPVTTFIGAWRRLLKRCGIRYLPPHALRHTFASHSIMAGVPLLKVSRYLGHKTTRITERYAHLAGDDGSQELNKVEKWHQGGTTRSETKKSESENSS